MQRKHNDKGVSRSVAANTFTFEETDFGFTNVEIINTQPSYPDRIQKMLDMIEPFLNNLCQNPEKSTINWPNRVEKIEEFKTKLRSIANGQYEIISGNINEK